MFDWTVPEGDGWRSTMEVSLSAGTRLKRRLVGEQKPHGGTPETHKTKRWREGGKIGHAPQCNRRNKPTSGECPSCRGVVVESPAW